MLKPRPRPAQDLEKTHYPARSGNPAKRVRGVPGMFSSLEVKVLYPT